MDFTFLKGCERKNMTETLMLLIKPKIFTVWSFREKACQRLFYTIRDFTFVQKVNRSMVKEKMCYLYQHSYNRGIAKNFLKPPF